MLKLPFGFSFSLKNIPNPFAKGRLTNTYPTSALAWMAHRGMQPRFVETTVDGRPQLSIVLRDAATVYGGLDPSSLRYDFEKKFDAFSQLQSSQSTKATKCDTVASDPIFGTQIKALENKITVLPDNTTKHLPEDQWGTEIVFRPNTIANSTMQLFLNMSEPAKHRLRELSKTLGLNNIRDWRSEAEVGRHYEAIDAFAIAILQETVPTQSAYMLQAVWSTDGSPFKFTANPCDLLVWTDLSILSAVYRETDASSGNKDSIGRARRAIVRFAVSIDELLCRGFINYDNIYRDIAFTNQNDKELSIVGTRLRQLLGPDAFNNRRITEEDFDEILGEDAAFHITPERRFDACYFISKLLRALNLTPEQQEIADRFLCRTRTSD
jgi:hypothetical protein